MPMQMNRTALDTLHSVAEVSERTFGGFTGKKPMRSLGHQGPIEEDETEGKGPKKGAAAARFPRAAVKILKDWMIAHIDHPYPTEEEKEALGQQTGLSMSQISNWMANTRRRHKARPKRTSSPSLRPVTEPVNVPPGRTWESLNPFERWKHSPPENEPAPLQAIAHNVENFDFPDDADRSAASSYRKENSNDSTGSFSVFRAPSITSLETGLTILSSGSIGTFCTDRFKNKYDWTRHEKSLHLSLEKWICAPLGDVITCSSSGQRKCVYCDEVNPSNAHLESHNHLACEEKGMEARTFYRKDHLRQHLRLMHGWGLDPHVAQHVTNAMPPYLIANESKSPFPFSATNSSSMKHPGMSLDQPDLEVLLPNSNDISPKTCNFAVDESTSTGTTQRPSPHTTSPHRSPHPYATCWEILTLRLGRFARQHIEQHGSGSVTDAMLQSEARRILYDSDDAWEQTAADNPEWLNLFRKAHGMDLTQPQAIAGQYSNHEVLEDLGLGPNAQLDESFNLKNFHCISKNFHDPRTMAMSKAGEVSVPITHMLGATTSAPTSATSNLPISSFTDFGGLDLNATINDLEGTGAGGFCIGDDGEFCTTSAPLSKSHPAFMTPINELACNASNNAIDPDYGFPVFSTADPDFDMTATSTGFGSTLAATSGFSDSDLSAGATIDQSQMLPWDDTDLTFSMDMDLDMDLGMPTSSGA
ncbi:uncharacterized protein N0V89_001223 [Didymosphaeria variabile]|uniref:Homeobox domain-containing protein n=1 Tax=Didymosphaeria variabile TaxID=1932322 RepID=A0A9W8XYA2_9PLEO|nr:uncharacterized protein N0V89_001223 [Didymosphaeria variabile]KAJ4360657.1 hypothetical protein N0V89_001223 [Didymosphaeria variabile]